MRKIFYEWIVTLSKGEDLYLTENQYQHYKDNWKEGQMFFRDFNLNPSFVVKMEKKPGEHLLEKYPCSACHMNGQVLKESGSGSDNSFEECKNCKGTGADIR